MQSEGFLRLKQILELIPVSKATWWRGVKKGRFPKSVKMGSCTFWKAEDIQGLIEKTCNAEATHEYAQ